MKENWLISTTELWVKMLFFVFGLTLIGMVLTLPQTLHAESCVAPAQDIVAWWPFDNGDGATTEDIVGTHPGIFVGDPAYGQGMVGGAARFSGSQYIQVEDSDLWGFGSGDFTIELWANTNQPWSSQIFIGNDECGGPCNKWFFGFYVGFGFHINSPSLGDIFLGRSSYRPEPGTWHHYAVTRSGSTYTFFVDGAAVATDNNSAVIPNPAAPLTIGQAEGLGWVDGLLDEITIYHRALTQEQINAIYLAGDAGKCKTTRPVTPSQAANTGSVTLTLAGEEFTPETSIMLSGMGLPTLNPTAVTFVSTGALWAVFDLAGASTGLYDLTITTPGAPLVVHKEAFEVIEGTMGQLGATLHGPPAVRNFRKYSWGLQYSNSGGADLDAPLLVISNNDDSQMSLSATKPFTKEPLHVLAINQNLPPGTLPPGNSSGLSFFQYIAGADPIITINRLVEDATPIPWDAMEADLQPSDMDPTAWEIIFDNFRGQMGETWEEYARTLRADATYLSLYRHSLRGTLAEGLISLSEDADPTIYDVSALLAFEFARASGALSPRSVLAAAQDMYIPAPGLPLSFSRFAPQPIDGRLWRGPLGRGWAHSYEVSATVAENQNITIKGPGGSTRTFFLQGSGSYMATAGDFGTVTLADGAVTLREKNGIIWKFGTAGELSSVHDTNGNSLTLAYSDKRLAAVTHSNGESLTFVYDGNGLLTEVHDLAGRVVSYRYGGPDGEHLTETRSPDEFVTAYTYHPADGSASAHALEKITFPDNTHHFYTYDSRGRLIEEYRDGGAEKVSYDYEDPGTVTVTDAIGNTALARFGPYGEVLEMKDPKGALVKMAYDANTQTSQIVGPDGKATALAYDGMGNPLGVVNPLGATVEMTLEPSLSRMQRLKDPRGNETGFAYDDAGNLTSITYPDGSGEGFTYDETGESLSHTNRRGNKVELTRNGQGQITQKTYPDGRVVAYGYDARGNLVSATDSITGAITMSYDLRDLLTRVDYPEGLGFEFTYDDAGRRIRRESHDGEAIDYAYDEVGRLKTLSVAGEEIVRYVYDAAGRLQREIKGNGTYTEYGYDAAGLLLSLVNYSPGGQVLSRFDYTYDLNGNRTAVITLDGTTSYRYDAAGRLTGVTYPDAHEVAYAYDEAGNRTTVTDGAEATNYSTNNMNQYLQVGAAVYAYDEDGNTISKTDAAGTTTYEYDAENRLVRVVTPDKGTWEYGYDALGNRITVSQDGKVRRYLHDPAGIADIAAEYNNDGALVARYTHGHGLVARTDGSSGGRAFYTFDAVGHTRQMTDDAGAVVNSYDYDPFGEIRGIEEAVPNPFRYVGRLGVMDENNGLVFMRARYYDAGIGRFTTEDPIGLLGGDVNLYGYAWNSPLAFSDPTGLLGLPDWYDPSKWADILEGTDVARQFYSDMYGKQNWVSQGLIDTAFDIADVVVKELPIDALRLGEYGSSFGDNLGRIASIASLAIQPIKFGFKERAWFNYKGSLSYKAWLTKYKNLSGNWKRTKYFDSVEKMSKWLKERAKWVKIVEAQPQLVKPGDPNEKTASAGVGEQHAIAAGDEISYVVYFENKPTATAPAQEVFIDDTLDEDLDWSTFQLGEIAFGSQVINSLAGMKSGQVRVPAGDMLLDITVTTQTETGKVNWTLRTIDPETGDLPEDPFAGFLPPEDGSGRGQGYVSFTVRSQNSLASGTLVTNTASIIFDTEAAMMTNEVFNTVSEELPAAPADPASADSASSVPISAVLSWAESQYATSYEIFLWKADQSKPTTPMAVDLDSPFYDPPGELDFASTYYWQVVARNVMGLTSGPVWSFTTATLQFPLIVQKAGTGEGAVTSEENPPLLNCGLICGKSYDADTKVILTAMPQDGSTLTGWSGCDATNYNQCEVTLTSTRTITANFNDSTPPEPPVVTGPSLTNTPQPTWSWTSGGGGNGTYRYQFDSQTGEWSETKALSYTPAKALNAGIYTLFVQERDIAGNWSASGSKAITIDNSPPDTSITGKPASLSNSKEAAFSFSATELDATFRCQLDTGADEACVSPKTYVGVADGSHTFSVKATDAALNTDPTPATYTWTVDTVPPDAPVVSGTTPTESPRPTWTWINGGGDGNRTYRYKLDDNDLSSGTFETTATTYTPAQDLAVGTHTLFVQERDAAGNWSASGSKPITITDQPPVAQAGPDQNVITGSIVSLDGSNSYDPEGALITFSWSFLEVPSDSIVSDTSLSDKASAQPVFTPDVDGIFSLQLMVNDGKLDSEPDQVTITAATPNVAPNANAGPDQNVVTGEPVYLDGTGSNDPDGWPDPLSYLWGFVSLPPESRLADSAITDCNQAWASFIPDVEGSYMLRLLVSDGELESEDTVNLIAVTLNAPPNADAGADVTTYLGETVTFDGSASSDPDNGPSALNYNWRLVAVPADSMNSNEDIVQPNSEFPSFTPDTVGTYVLELAVNDGEETSYDNVAVTVKEKAYIVSGGAYNYPESTTYKATFSMNVTGPNQPSGWLKYYYAKTRMNFVSNGITAVAVAGKTATITGTGTVNNVVGYTFTAIITDESPDKFGITIMKASSSYFTASPSNTSGGDLVIQLQ